MALAAHCLCLAVLASLYCPVSSCTCSALSVALCEASLQCGTAGGKANWAAERALGAAPPLCSLPSCRQRATRLLLPKAIFLHACVTSRHACGEQRQRAVAKLALAAASLAADQLPGSKILSLDVRTAAQSLSARLHCRRRSNGGGRSTRGRGSAAHPCRPAGAARQLAACDMRPVIQCCRSGSCGCLLLSSAGLGVGLQLGPGGRFCCPRLHAWAARFPAVGSTAHAQGTWQYTACSEICVWVAGRLAAACQPAPSPSTHPAPCPAAPVSRPVWRHSLLRHRPAAALQLQPPDQPVPGRPVEGHGKSPPLHVLLCKRCAALHFATRCRAYMFLCREPAAVQAHQALGAVLGGAAEQADSRSWMCLGPSLLPTAAWHLST